MRGLFRACVNATFPRDARVRTGAEYARVFELSRRTSDPLLSLHWLAGEAPARLGLAVSRKVNPHAVGRNRIKRILRDTFRQVRSRLPPGDYVVVARSAAKNSCNTQLRETFLRTLVRAGALPALAPTGTMPSDTSPGASLSRNMPKPDTNAG